MSRRAADHAPLAPTPPRRPVCWPAAASPPGLMFSLLASMAEEGRGRGPRCFPATASSTGASREMTGRVKYVGLGQRLEVLVGRVMLWSYAIVML